MRTRSVAILAGLVVCVVAFARAQQSAEGPAPAAANPANPQSERAKLRAQLVKLNTEVELLQLEHEAEWAVLLEALKSVQQSEMLAEVGNPQVTLMGAHASAGLMKGEANQAVAAGMAKGQSRVAAGQQYAKTVEFRRNEATRQYVERRKKEFARHAAELTEKRFEYGEAEKRLNAM